MKPYGKSREEAFCFKVQVIKFQIEITHFSETTGTIYPICFQLARGRLHGVCCNLLLHWQTDYTRRQRCPVENNSKLSPDKMLGLHFSQHLYFPVPSTVANRVL